MADKKLREQVEKLLDVEAWAQRDPRMRRAVQAVEAVDQASELVRRIRKSKGLTQAQLGKKLGVSQARISQIESGSLENSPSIETLSEIAGHCDQRLHVTVADEVKELREALSEAKSALEALRSQIAKADQVSVLAADTSQERLTALSKAAELKGAARTIAFRKLGLREVRVGPAVPFKPIKKLDTRKVAAKTTMARKVETQKVAAKPRAAREPAKR